MQNKKIKNGKIILLIPLILAMYAFLAYATAPNPGHDAEQVGSGTFSGVSSDVWSFPGKVGIETTAPTASLTIGPNPLATISANEIFQIAKTGSAYMTVGDGTGRVLLGTAAGLPFTGSYSNTDFTIRTNNVEKVRVTSGGNVGIGTTTPGQKLSVSGNAVFGDTTANTYQVRLAGGVNVGEYRGIAFTDVTGNTVYSAIKFLNDAGSDSSIRFLTWDGTSGGSEKMVIKGVGGNVGIGTAAPGAKLDVNQASAGIFGIRISRAGGASDANNWYLWNMDGAYGNDFEIWQYPNDGQPSCCIQRFEIKDDGTTNLVPGGGNVGIGTTGPNSKLTIGTDFASIVGQTIDTGGSSDSALVARKAASKPAFGILPWDSQVYLSSGIYYDGGSWVHHSDTNDNQLFTMDPGQGILWYASNTGTGSWNVASAVQLWDDSANWKSTIQSTRSGTSYITGGNVGIGMTNPTNQLEVYGTSGNMALCATTGCLPGYPSTQYPVLKSTGSYIYVSVAGAYSAYINSAGTWTSVSSREKKENFVEIDPQLILAKIDQMPMYQWNFKGENSSIKHIAPIAEDFHLLFGLNGDDDKMISNIDPSGVALVGIKALSNSVKELQAEKDAEIGQLREENRQIKKENEALKEAVCEINPSAGLCVGV